MKDTIRKQENEIHIDKEEVIEEGEVNFLSSLEEYSPQILGKSTEIRKAEMRDKLDRISIDWADTYLVKHLKYIIETSVAEWWSKNLQVAMKWIEHISKLMWYTETNQSYTIKSNIPVVWGEEANRW